MHDSVKAGKDRLLTVEKHVSDGRGRVRSQILRIRDIRRESGNDGQALRILVAMRSHVSALRDFGAYLRDRYA